MLTTIMLCTFNRLDLTKLMIKSLYETTNIGFNLIIVDNGSSDGTASWLKYSIKTSEFCKNFDLILNSENKGIAYGRNQGLLASKKYDAEYLCTLDNDIELVPGWLTDIISIIKVNPDYCIGLNYEGVEYPQVNVNGKSFSLKSQGNLGTATAVFSSSLFEKIGYMYASEKYAHEDANYFFRARKAGYKMGYLKNARHLGEGENDVGEYREWKTKCSKDSLASFIQDCHAIAAGIQDIYVGFNEDK